MDVNRLCTIALAALVLGTSGPLVLFDAGTAEAADRGKARARKSRSDNGKASRPRKAPAPAPRAAEPEVAEEAAPPPASTTTASEPTGNGSGSGAARAGKPRVYTFGGLDLEGKLRTPQLLYFRGRMRQELDASSLQRRSFLKELEKTADDQGL
jgi:hypothetical protein